MRLRSIELETPQHAAALQFLLGPWGLLDAGAHHGTTICAPPATLPMSSR